MPENDDVNENLTTEERGRQLPDPSGYKILCAVPQLDVKDTFDDSIIVRPGVNTYQETQATVVLFVISLGPDAYTDKTRYPSGPWCKKGDFVIVRQYSGTFVQIHGKSFRFINEDQVEGTISDPRGIVRALAL